MTANLGNSTIVISARIGDGQPSDIGEIELPVIAEETRTIGNVSITARVRVDEAELRNRLAQFAAAVSDEMTSPAAADATGHPQPRMIGAALDIDSSPEFQARLAEAKDRMAKIQPSGLLDGPEHVIIGARQEGKTRLALKWLNDVPEGVKRVLIVKDSSQAEHLKLDCGFSKADPRIIGYRTLVNQGARKGVEYGIDESVQILTAILGLKENPRLITVGHAEAWQAAKA